MELLFYSGIVSIIDWKYTKSIGIKNQVFWAGPWSYNTVNNEMENKVRLGNIGP